MQDPLYLLYRSGLLKDDEAFNLTQETNMKTLIALIVTMFALTSFAAEPAKKEEKKPVVAEKKAEKKAPSDHKPTAKKVEKKVEAK